MWRLPREARRCICCAKTNSSKIQCISIMHLCFLFISDLSQENICSQTDPFGYLSFMLMSVCVCACVWARICFPKCLFIHLFLVIDTIACGWKCANQFWISRSISFKLLRRNCLNAPQPNSWIWCVVDNKHCLNCVHVQWKLELEKRGREKETFSIPFWFFSSFSGDSDLVTSTILSLEPQI